MEGSGKILIVAVGLSSQSGQIYALLGATASDKKKDKKDKDTETLPKSAGGKSVETTVIDALEEDQSENKTADIDEHQSVLQKKLTRIATQIGKVGENGKTETGTTNDKKLGTLLLRIISDIPTIKQLSKK